MMIIERWIKIRLEFMEYLTLCARNTLCFACTHEVIIIRLAFLPARASEQGNLIGLVSVYIYIYTVKAFILAGLKFGGFEM